jgi:DNA-binding GntR family transcriptional regulator
MPPRSYQRIAADLRRRIAAGEWAPGDRIPSWRQLQAEYRVGQGAIRLAIEQLRAEGLVEGQPRTRLTVTYRPAVRTLINADAPWPYGRGDIELSAVRADEELARRLAVPLRARLHRERVELLDPDGRPAMVSTAWRRSPKELPYAACLYETYADNLRRDSATLLGLVVGAPVLIIERTRLDHRGQPVETADLVLPADRWRVRW